IENKNLIPEIEENLQITAQSYATISGKRFFIKPNLFNKVGKKYNADDKRQFDIEYSYAFHDIDSIAIRIPSGYTIESLPKEMVLISKFGLYSIKFKVQED